ncbi:MAG: hypothetical protein WCO60_01755 [Verrucomicrobiota bacterium]
MLNLSKEHSGAKVVASMLAVTLCVGVVGCATSKKLGEKTTAKESVVKEEEPLEIVKIRFLEGVLTHDRVALAKFLTPDFSWREDESPMQETPFDFWERHKLWGELQKLAGERVVKSGNMMVSPKAASRPEFNGSRLGWRQVGGEWRLAYFYAGTQAVP